MRMRWHVFCRINFTYYQLGDEYRIVRKQM